MKKITFWIVIAQLCAFSNLFAQQTIIEKSSPMKMGECTAQKISLVFDKEVAYKVLDIEVPIDGDYTFDMVVNASNSQKENLRIILDNVKKGDEIILAKKDSWTLGSMKNVKDNKSSTIFLSKGIHEIKLSFGNSEIPMTDEIIISRLGNVSKLNTNKQDDYLNFLKTQKLPTDYLTWKKKSKGGRIASNPKGNYDHQLDIAYTYTYYESFSFTQGQVVTFETKNNSADPVMYLFNSSYGVVVNVNSWVNDDYNGLNSYISVTIPASGIYTVFIRAYGSYYEGNNYGAGTCDLWKNGTLYKSSIPVAGRSYSTTPKANQDVNFFTSKLSSGADTRLFISGSRNSVMEFQNDDYNVGAANSNFSWGLASRIKVAWFSQPEPFVHLVSYSISSIGSCDLYMNNLNSDNVIFTDFPNLKPDDAIQSAPATGLPPGFGENGAYNCASWAGGITTYWSWPGRFAQWASPDYNFLKYLDNFYGNTPKRYVGAYTYTRSGATAENASLALWANPNLETGDDFNTDKYTHVSVTKPGNDNPHGYDWESKPGGNNRFFHPKESLNNFSPKGYGSIVSYYKYTGSNAARIDGEIFGMTLEESINKGLSVMDKVEFDSNENTILTKKCLNLQSKLIDEFNYYLSNLDKISNDPSLFNSSSIRQIYGNTTQYKQLKEWSLKQGKSLYPLIIKTYSPKKPYTLLLIEDILASPFQNLLTSVKEENIKNDSDESGVYIVRTDEMNCIRFLKKMIKLYETNNSTIENTSLGQNYPNSMENSTSINFELENKSEISLQIYNDKGVLIKTLIDSSLQEAGKHLVTWDGKNNEGNKVLGGIYIYRLITPHFSDSRRILIE
jgi:FlgD Ig-like domain